MLAIVRVLRLWSMNGKAAMAVENFYQGEIFPDTFPPVPTIDIPQNPAETKVHSNYLVVRSPRRKKSISAFRRNGVIEIHIPARTTKKEEAALVKEMITMVLSREARVRRTDATLEILASQLLAQFLPEFSQKPSSITWRAMRDRWGSCTTVDRTIRISERLQTAPEFVLRCVLFHELIHLEIPDHGKEFYTYLSRFDERERAESYLSGFEAGLASKD
ncbi:MAG: M48 family metallopeptidase [Actinomycetes bacterium]